MRMSKIYEERIMWILASDPRNSMSFWWPRIKHMTIPQPKTIRFPLNRKAYFKTLFDDSGKTPPPKGDKEDFLKACQKLGFPVFMRTAETSAKHSWNKTCFVKSEEQLNNNFWSLLEDNYLAVDHIPDAVFFREFIPMESYFTGWYNDFPVNKEVRTFIKNGEMQCWHPYWPPGAMEQAKPSDPKWKEKYEKLCDLEGWDVNTIVEYSNMVAKEFDEVYDDPGWWSVDFAKGKDGKWYLIDMALGAVSAHYFGCDNIPKVRMRDGSMRKEQM